MLKQGKSQANHKELATPIRSPTLMHVALLNRVLLHGDLRKHTDQCGVNFVGKERKSICSIMSIPSSFSNGKEIGRAIVVSVGSEVRCNGFKSLLSSIKWERA